MPISRSVDRIAITLGDPAGIGPEVTLKTLARLGPSLRRRILLTGPASLYEGLARAMRLRLRFVEIDRPSARTAPGAVPCLYPHRIPPRLKRGRPQPVWARTTVNSIDIAVSLALSGQVSAIVTAPINKAALMGSGFRFPGHTEYLAHLARAERCEMMLVGGPLRVVLVTRHLPLARVPRAVTAARVTETIRTTHDELVRSFGIARPRLVVCGLNPHAGEEGHLGQEEIRTIAPAVRRVAPTLRGPLVGPLSPDALFHEAYQGKYDAVICMYHDQGLIPLKMISRGSGVNVTLGLPFVRTSPDHGTAYDIAVSLRADAGSMTQAVHLAATLGRQRRSYEPHLRSPRRTR